MIPEKIPDKHIWPGAKRVTFNPPRNHDSSLMEILPVEAVVDFPVQGDPTIPRVHVRIAVDAQDTDLLHKNGFFYLVFYGGVMPFDVGHPEVDELMDVEAS